MPRKSSGIKQDNPLLIELLSIVFNVNGWEKPLADNDFIDLEVNFNKKLKELSSKIKFVQDYTIGISTLRRLLKMEKYDKSFDISCTLNPLAKLGRFESWAYYSKDGKPKNKYNEKPDLPIFYEVDIIDDTNNLNIGTTLKMGWYPNRYVELKYMGDCEFEILKYVGAYSGNKRTVIPGFGGQ